MQYQRHTKKISKRGGTFVSNCRLQRVKWTRVRSPIFLTTKPKTNKVRFISDFRNVNKRLKHEPYPIPKINEVLFKWEGFQYATPLDLNIGYYHIIMTEGVSDLCMIVLSRRKYRYKCLTMGVINLPDIFQQKMIDLFQLFEFICAYIDALLILTKG